MLLLCIESKTINKIKIITVVIFVLTLNSDALNVLNLVSSRFQKRLLTKIIKNELELFTGIKKVRKLIKSTEKKLKYWKEIKVLKRIKSTDKN